MTTTATSANKASGTRIETRTIAPRERRSGEAHDSSGSPQSNLFPVFGIINWSEKLGN